jgi:glycosyltransferase involved in cell wall biosynthesis
VGKLHICLRNVFGSSWLGGALYIQNLARAIASLPAEERQEIKLSVVVRSSNGSMAKVMLPYVDSMYIDGIYKLACSEACKWLAKAPFLPLHTLNPRKFDFVYPDVAGERAPYRWGGWIPDFQYRHLPQMFTQQQIDRFEKIYTLIAHTATVVVLSSKMAQEDFHRFYPDTASRSKVMSFVSYIESEWFTFDPKETQKKYRLPDRFFLVSNQFWKHKDHGTLIEALGILKDKGMRPVVVCTGSADDNATNYFKKIVARISELGLDGQVHILGFIPRFDQIQLMRRSLAVIQPSLFEGWSTVVEDTRSVRKPILISDFPVHLEQNPPDGHFFERGNREQLASLIAMAFDTLETGPDLNREVSVQQANRERLVAYGRRFLDIVRGALY